MTCTSRLSQLAADAMPLQLRGKPHANFLSLLLGRTGTGNPLFKWFSMFSMCFAWLFLQVLPYVFPNVFQSELGLPCPKLRRSWPQDVSIPSIASKTKNFSGAELEGLIRSATSYAAGRKHMGHMGAKLTQCLAQRWIIT